MEFIDEGTVKIDKILNSLDKAVIKFSKTLEKHVNYVIVSGYIAILFGRSRNTEDVDFILEKMDSQKFMEFFDEVTSQGFYFLESSKRGDLFEQLSEGLGIRAAENGRIFPNMELKFPKKRTDFEALSKKIKVLLGKDHIFTSSIEMQIAYKEKVLGSEKDIEDAYHLRLVFGKHLKAQLLNHYLDNIENAAQQRRN